MRSALPLAVLAAGVLLGAVGHASQVHFRTLDEVLPKASMVFDAEVVKATRSQTPNETQMHWELRDPHAIRGALPTVMRAIYTEIIPVMRDKDGNIIGSFSPILDASGEEWSATKGRWIFLASSASKSELRVLRVEPMARLAEIPGAPAPSASVAPAPPPSASGPSAQASAAPEPAPPPAVRSGRGCGCSVPSGGESDATALALAIGILACRARRRRVGLQAPTESRRPINPSARDTARRCRPPAARGRAG